jgi:hypothetical protein
MKSRSSLLVTKPKAKSKAMPRRRATPEPTPEPPQPEPTTPESPPSPTPAVWRPHAVIEGDVIYHGSMAELVWRELIEGGGGTRRRRRHTEAAAAEAEDDVAARGGATLITSTNEPTVQTLRFAASCGVPEAVKRLQSLDRQVVHARLVSRGHALRGKARIDKEASCCTCGTVIGTDSEYIRWCEGTVGRPCGHPYCPDSCGAGPINECTRCPCCRRLQRPPASPCRKWDRRPDGVAARPQQISSE